MRPESAGRIGPGDVPVETRSRCVVAGLYRYPIKGLSPQPEDSLDVVAGEGLPADRRFALALGTTAFDPRDPQPLDKGFFLMLRRDTSLAALKTRYVTDTGILTIEGPDPTALSADLGTHRGRAAVEAFFLDYLGEACDGRPRLVEAEGHKFTDVSVISPVMMRAVSLINLASVRDLSARCEQNLHPLRFRANIHVDGLDSWDELDWVGRDVWIGSAQFRGALRTKRCAGIDVDPVSGRRDTHLPKALMSHYGHPNCGIYLEVVDGGVIRNGDAVRVGPSDVARS